MREYVSHLLESGVKKIAGYPKAIIPVHWNARKYGDILSIAKISNSCYRRCRRRWVVNKIINAVTLVSGGISSTAIKLLQLQAAVL